VNGWIKILLPVRFGDLNPFPVTTILLPKNLRLTQIRLPGLQTGPPALDLTPEWDKNWYGYFGRGVLNSEFETFFVMDDSKDKEYMRNPFFFYPIAADTNRGGLGLRVEVRGFQWSHVLV
jgi:hypothetical protein